MADEASDGPAFTAAFQIAFQRPLEKCEIIALHGDRVIRLPGFQVIDPKGAQPYVRSAPDETKINNLESLPSF